MLLYICVCVWAYTILWAQLLNESSWQKLDTHTTGDLPEEMAWLDFVRPCCIDLHANEDRNQTGQLEQFLFAIATIVNNHFAK